MMTKGLISCAVTASVSLFSHMQKSGFLMVSYIKRCFSYIKGCGVALLKPCILSDGFIVNI